LSGFILDDESLDQISGQLPDFETLNKTVIKFSPDIISIKCPIESNIPVAAVCLRDMVKTLLSVRIALHEYHSHRIWYREKSDPPNEPLAIIMMRYYVDDAVARLYASGEHLANAIIFMLDVTDKQLKPYRNKRTSQQIIVGQYLASEQPKNRITHAVINLAKSAEWIKTIAYRNRWVHEQPPSIKGLGVVYRRERRWVTKNESDGKTNTSALGIGGGDDAEFSVDEIMNFVQPATFQFANVCNEVASSYIKILNDYGIVITDKEIQVNLFERATPKSA
jgi:hypothetical protein